jgi:hypothetical protein
LQLNYSLLKLFQRGEIMNDVKVENGTVKGDEVTFTGDFVFKGGKNLAKAVKEAMPDVQPQTVEETNKYPKAEDLKSEIPDFKDVEIKVENQGMQGENFTLHDGELFKGGTDFAKVFEDIVSENKYTFHITDGDMDDITGTPEEIKAYNEEQDIKQKELLKILQDPNTKRLDVSGAYTTQETKAQILEVMNKLRDDPTKNNDVKPK